jgi:hypothetical protein
LIAVLQLYGLSVPSPCSQRSKFRQSYCRAH